MTARRSVAIVGLGLIGGSLALALRRAGHRVTGADQSRAALVQARRRGAVAHGTTSLRDAIADAGIVVLCVPPSAIGPVMVQVGRGVARDAVITDACSIKRDVVLQAGSRLPAPERFVGAHPMAGSERSGIGSASPDLFRGCTCAITPVPGTRRNAVRVVEAMWRSVGARPLRMSPTDHDRATAVSSHLPHLLAFALADAARSAPVRRLAAGSFRDATRVAHSDPALWAGILEANRTEIRRALTTLTRTADRLLRTPGPGGRQLKAAAAGLRGVPR